MGNHEDGIAKILCKRSLVRDGTIAGAANRAIQRLANPQKEMSWSLTILVVSPCKIHVHVWTLLHAGN